MSVKTVVFVCTGNYYRSRFAEGLFNHLASQGGLNWQAQSCGLGVGRAETGNVGPIAAETIEAFKQRSIPVTEPIRYPRAATLKTFTSADLVIALKEAEHRALMRQQFPDWTDRITYWHVHDLDHAPAHIALQQIESLVRALIARLSRCGPKEDVQPQ
jgi:protein-tyrosine phosphatase